MARVTINLTNRNRITRSVKDAVEEAIHDVSDDLVRTSSESAPHDKGILEQSYSKSVGWQGTKCIAVVDYSVMEENGQGGFNYALWIHDGDYELGEGSLQKAAGGGGVGMSGRSYPVGPKFLTGPLEGEATTYKNHIQSVVDANLS